MDSIGDKLRTARESKKLTIKEVVKETNINPLYIEALEEEKFDKFPSETYLVGFLRNYAEFLRLDVDAIVKAYKGYKIGESATPLEELTKPTKSSFMMSFSSFTNRYRNLLYVAGVIIVVLFLIYGFRTACGTDVDIADQESVTQMQDKYNKNNKAIGNVHILQFQKGKGSAFVQKKEAAQFMVDSKEVVFILKEIYPAAVDLEIQPGKVIEKLEIERPKHLKIEGCSRDVILTLKGLTENKVHIVVMLGEKDESVEVQEKVETPMKGDTTTVVATNKQNLKIVVDAEFTQKSFVELYLDGARKLQNFFPEGSKEHWEATELIQIKVGNAGGMRVQINNKDYKTFGAPGQVVNKTIRWKRDLANPNMWHIVVLDW